MKKLIGLILGMSLASMAKAQAIADYAQLISNFAIRLDSGSGVAGAAITGGTCTNQVMTALDTSGLPTCSSLADAMVAANTFTLGKLAFSATQRVSGRNTAAAGAGEEVTATQVLDWIGGTQGQVLYRGAANWTALATGTSGQFLQTQGAAANPQWATPTSGTVNQLTTVYTHEEFLGNRNTATSTCAGGGGGLGLAVTNTGGTAPGSNVNVQGTPNHPGICQWDTGTSAAAGASSVNNGMNTSTPASMYFALASTLEWETCVTVLSASADLYTLYQGFGDSSTGVEPTDGCYFTYTDTVNSGNWVGKCSKGAARTSTNTAVAPTVCPTMQRMTISVNSNATSVAFATDGTASAGGAVTGANIPVSATNEFGLQFSIAKTGGAGILTRGFQLDFIDFVWTLSR